MTTDVQTAATPAWGEYAICQVPQFFTPVAGKNISYSLTGLGTIASNDVGKAVLTLDAQAGRVTIQRSGRFMLCGSLYVAGAIQKANPDYTIDVAGMIAVRIPLNPSPNPGIGSHEIRLGQWVVRLSSLGNLQSAGFSFSQCIALMLPQGTQISLRVEVFADNLSKGQFLSWQVRSDAAAGGANLSIHELGGA